MSCNCNPVIPCTNCQKGVHCNCPPSYPIPNQVVPCTCCPNGYTYQSPSGNYPNGICVSSTGGSSTSWCCLPGYTYNPAIGNNGMCSNDGGKTYLDPIRCPSTTATIACVPCEEIITTDCVQYSGIIPIECGTTPGNIYGIIPGDTLTTIISKMCISNENVMEALLTSIGLSTRALAGFCNLVGLCGSLPGTTVPIIGPILFHIP